MLFGKNKQQPLLFSQEGLLLREKERCLEKFLREPSPHMEKEGFSRGTLAGLRPTSQSQIAPLFGYKHATGMFA